MTGVVDPAVQRRVLVVLAAGQVLGGIGISVAIVVSTLVATRLSGSEAIGGVAQTCVVIGAAVVALLVAKVATRSGRRPALVLGYGIGGIGGLGCVAAVAAGSAAALLVALVLVGAGSAAGLASRYAATDLAAPDRRAGSLALIMWASTVGAVAGPNLAGPVQDLAGRIGLEPATGPFLLSAAAFLLSAVTAWSGLRPDPLVLARAADVTADPAPVRGSEVRAALLASHAALLGVAGVALSHLVMVGLMSMTPVHMDHGGATIAVVGLVISLHVAGMYALSPLIGWLADRAGRATVLAGGAVLLLASGVLCAMAGPGDTALLSVGLFLLGLGWSAGIVAGSALLTESVPLRVRAGAQGFSDVTMNVCGAVGGIGAGLVVAGASFAVLGVVAAVAVVPYLVAAGSLAVRKPAAA
ncbi:MFS transporter [Actinomycetes bacterium KLBMP 9759]